MPEALEAWPATITQNMIRGSYAEEIVPTLIAFTPDRGAPLTRQGTYIPLRKVKFSSELTLVQKNALDTFYNTTCVQGTSRITRKNPKSGATVTVKFDGAPAYSDAGPDMWIATLSFWQFN